MEVSYRILLSREGHTTGRIPGKGTCIHDDVTSSRLRERRHDNNVILGKHCIVLALQFAYKIHGSTVDSRVLGDTIFPGDRSVSVFPII